MVESNLLESLKAKLNIRTTFLSSVLWLVVVTLYFNGISYAGNYSVIARVVSASTGQTLTVDWTAPAGSSAKDWIGLFKTGVPNSAYDQLRWRYTGGSTTGVYSVSAPEPGTYEFRYLINDGFTPVSVSQTITVVGGGTAVVAKTYSLNALPTTVQTGENISVNWTAPEGSSAKDWIAWYKSNAPNNNYGQWRYTGGSASGTFTITAPLTPGTYEFRYLINDGFTSAAVSQPITVTTATTATVALGNAATTLYGLSATPLTVQAGQSLSVNWSAPNGTSAKDWIGWFITTDPNSNFDKSRWRYTNGAANGTFAIAAPSTPGTYEFRYLLNDGYTSVARSQSITVTGTTTASTGNAAVTTTNTVTDPVAFSLAAAPASVLGGQNVVATWSAPKSRSPKDWIGLFKIGSDNTAFDQSRWVYTGGVASGTFTVSAPSVSGIYEFRYLLNDGYVKATSSNTVTVTAASVGPRVVLTASPSTISTGQSSLLSWTAENLTSCSASGNWSGAKNLADYQTVLPISDSTYTLTCTGPLGSASQSVTVSVNQNSSANLYYVATNGNDNGSGTQTSPFATLRKAVSVLKPGDTLLVRGGEYDTVNGLTIDGQNSAIPSGLSWSQPVTIKAYPGENPVFRRYLPAGSPPEDVVAKSIHLPTYQECVNWAQARWGSSWSNNFRSYPYDCWTGSGSANDGLYYQTPYGFVGGAIITMFNDFNNAVQYVVFDGIDFDARGIVQNNMQLYGAQHIRFINSTIRNSIGSCVTQPGIPDSSIVTDLQFIRVKIHSCGVPFDTNLINGVPARKSPFARFFHPWYMHAGGNLLEESEVYNSAGTGLGPDGGNNIIRNNYIHDNSAGGLYIAGGDGFLVENNIFYNNGGAGIHHQNGGNHIIRHNTVVQDAFTSTPAQYGILLNVNSWAGTYENNIVVGSPYGFYNLSTAQSQTTLRKNLITSTLANREIVNESGSVPVISQSNLLGQDPRFLGPNDFRLQAGSPALGTATDGGNIGAE